MHTLDHIRLAVKEIQRRPVRSALTLVALAVSAIILVTLTGLSFGANQAITTALSPNNSLQTIVVTPNQQTGQALMFGSVQEATARAAKLDDATLQAIQETPGVATVSPRVHIWEFSTFTLGDTQKQFVAQTEGVAPGDPTIPLSAGQPLTGDEQSVVVGLAYAQALGKTPQELVGQTMHIQTQKGYRGEGAAIPGPRAATAELEAFNEQPTKLTAKVVGVTAEGANQNSIFIPTSWAKRIRAAVYYDVGQLKTVDQFSRDGYTTVVVQATNQASVPRVEAALQAAGFGTTSALRVVAQWLSLSTALWVILGAVALVALLGASLGIVNTMLVAVSEQRVSIGVWRAFGATKMHIAIQFLLQAALIGCAGGAIGVGAGLMVGHFVNLSIAELLQAGNLQSMSIAAPPVWLWAACFVLVVLFSVVAGLYPALLAARQDPAKSLNAQ